MKLYYFVKLKDQGITEFMVLFSSITLLNLNNNK